MPGCVYVQVHVHVWKTNMTSGYHTQLFILFLETGSLIKSTFHRLARQLVNKAPGSSVPASQSLKYRHMPSHPAFYVGARD